MDNLETKLKILSETPSDINEHLYTISKYSKECNYITEMGVRGVISTWALLNGRPKKMVSYDIQHPNQFGQDINEVYDVAEENNIKYDFILANVLDVQIEPTELLFIDTWHSYKQLKKELNIHSKNVSKYIILHDTTSYEFNDEVSYEMWGEEWKGEGVGLWKAVEEFLMENNDWILHERFVNNNGLTILKKL